MISFENELEKTGGMMKVYKEIRKELKAYGHGLEEKDEIILLTKTDMVDDPKLIAKKIQEFEKLGKTVFAISLYDDVILKKFRDALAKLIKE